MVLVPPQEIYITITLSSSVRTKAPTQVEDGNFRLSTRFLEHRPVASPPTNKKKVCTQWKIMKTLTPSPNDSPLKTFMVNLNLQSCFLDMSLPSPQVTGLLNKETFPFQPTLVSWVLAFKQQAAEPEFGNSTTYTTKCRFEESKEEPETPWDIRNNK